MALTSVSTIPIILVDIVLDRNQTSLLERQVELSPPFHALAARTIEHDLFERADFVSSLVISQELRPFRHCRAYPTQLQYKCTRKPNRR